MQGFCPTPINTTEAVKQCMPQKRKHRIIYYRLISHTDWMQCRDSSRSDFHRRDVPTRERNVPDVHEHEWS